MGSYLEAEFMGADWDPGVTDTLPRTSGIRQHWDMPKAWDMSKHLWETARSLGPQELPNVPVVIWGHGSLSVLRWARALGSWEPFGNLMLWKPPAGLGLVLE